MILTSFPFGLLDYCGCVHVGRRFGVSLSLGTLQFEDFIGVVDVDFITIVVAVSGAWGVPSTGIAFDYETTRRVQRYL